MNHPEQECKDCGIYYTSYTLQKKHEIINRIIEEADNYSINLDKEYLRKFIVEQLLELEQRMENQKF